MDYSIAIPVYNEETLIESAVAGIVEKLDQLDWHYELLIAENGSTDRTWQITEALQEKYSQVRALHTSEPNYGLALRGAIETASGTYVICDEIDICDTDFYERAIVLLESDAADLVVASKRHADSHDARPWIRRLATSVLNILFKLLLNFEGTDTHGLKAFHRGRLLPLVAQCVLEKDLFVSEFVIRAQRAKCRYVEVPIDLKEKRKPSIHLFRRVPEVLRSIWRLVVVIRFRQER